MTDKERLIRLMQEASQNKSDYAGNIGLGQIADYLLEHGVIVLPCKVGDTVWLLDEKCMYSGDKNKPWDCCEQYWDNVYHKGMLGCKGNDDEGNIICCEKEEMEWYAKQIEYSLELYKPHIVLGKNLFLSREEAERALKEREKEWLNT